MTSQRLPKHAGTASNSHRRKQLCLTDLGFSLRLLFERDVEGSGKRNSTSLVPRNL